MTIISVFFLLKNHERLNWLQMLHVSYSTKKYQFSGGGLAPKPPSNASAGKFIYFQIDDHKFGTFLVKSYKYWMVEFIFTVMSAEARIEHLKSKFSWGHTPPTKPP